MTEAPTVVIGERRFSLEREAQTEKRMQELLPMVEVLTDSTGAKLIPIEEFDKVATFIDQERKRCYNEGHTQGRTEGHQHGLNEGLTKAREVTSQLEQSISDTLTQRQALLEDAKQNVLQLVLKVCQKVTFGAIEVDPEKTLKLISGVIDSLIDRSRITIKVNPQHLPIIEQHIDDFLEGDATIKEIAIKADPRVRFGGCLIETPTGDIDARLDSQFDVIAEILAAVDTE